VCLVMQQIFVVPKCLTCNKCTSTATSLTMWRSSNSQIGRIPVTVTEI
jgi:hypothetical protein